MTELETTRNRMSLSESLRALHQARRDAIVVTTMGTAREWMLLEPHPLDFVFVPSSMGQATSLGLGLALAQPARNVIVCNGDGSMLMNLGSLMTIAAQHPPNLTVLVFDNGAYEVTGGQPTAANSAVRFGPVEVDLVQLARGCGFSSVFEFGSLSEWQSALKDVLEAPGPVFARLAVAAIPGAVGPKSPGPAPDRARAFASALQGEAANR